LPIFVLRQLRSSVIIDPFRIIGVLTGHKTIINNRAMKNNPLVHRRSQTPMLINTPGHYLFIATLILFGLLLSSVTKAENVESDPYLPITTDSYESKKRNPEKISDCQRALFAIETAKKSGQMLQLSDAHQNMAKFYSQSGMHRQASCHLDTARQLLQKVYHATQHTLDNISTQHKKQRLFLTLICIALLLLCIWLWKRSHDSRKREKHLFQRANDQSKLLEEEERKNALLQEHLVTKTKTRKTLSTVQLYDTELLYYYNRGWKKYDKYYNFLEQWIEEDKRYTQHTLTLSMAAKELKINSNYLSKAIKIKHSNFHAMLNKYRLKEAAALLACDSDCSLEYIAIMVGYKHYATFIEVVKRETGLTPSQWRDSISCHT